MSSEATGTMTEQVRGVIDEIRPFLQRDGGDIRLVDVDESTGVVSVQLQGHCSGCPHAAITLKMGVERHLKQHVPAVKQVVAVKGDDKEEAGEGEDQA
jgi:Fe-S cluster biogenesis protein NfuA